MKKIKNIIYAASIVTAVYFCLKYPKDIGESVENSINRCMTLIIPSMFIFMCITSFITNSGLHRFLGRPLRFISEKFFRIPEEGLAVFILSMIAGYPAGTKLVADSFKNGDINGEQAKRMYCFCFSSGPAFISGTAAGILYPNSNAGLLIFLSVTAGNIITALILSINAQKEEKKNKRNITSVSTGCIIPSVKSASSAMIQMCIMIAAFGGFCCILRLTGILQYISIFTGNILNKNPDEIYNTLMTILEISNIVNLPQMNISLMPVAASLLSFGGICVLMQITALSDKNFSIKMFIRTRLIAAFISGTVCRFLLRFLNMHNVKEAVSYNIISDNKYSPLPTIFLIIMMIMLLGTFKNSDKTKADV